MTFNRTTNPPSTSPRITITIAGLMILKPGANNTCDIGIHRWTTSHTFQVMLIVCKPGRPPMLVRLLTGPLTAPFLIRLDPDPGVGSFKVFAPTADPFVRAFTGNNDFDYRWAINLRELHSTAATNDGARPEVTMKTGVLYTPTLTRVGMDPEFVKGTLRIPLHRFAADLAAAIEPPSGSKIKLEWTELGDPQHLMLPRDGDPVGTSYIVSLLNDPPISSPDSHDELDLYYKILSTGGTTIPYGDRWKLEYVHFEKTDEIPCMPTILEP